MKVNLDYIISLLILSYFIIRTHGIAAYIPGYWIVPLLFLTIYTLYLFTNTKKREFNFLLIETKWIIFSLIIYIFYIVFDHGNFRLYSIFNNVLISIIFCYIGFCWGVKSKDKHYYNIIIWHFYFISVYLLLKLTQVSFTGSFSKETLGALFYTGAESINLNDLILYWPFFAFVTVIGAYVSFKNRVGISKILIVLFFIVNILVFTISGFAAPLFVIMVTGISYYFITYGINNTFKFIITLPIIFLILYGVLYIIGSGKFINSDALSAKAGSILMLIDSGFVFDDMILDQITSQRWTAAKYSFFQFMEKPIFGHGIYLESTEGMLGSLNAYTTAAGGHSFIIDIFAYQGVFGLFSVMVLVSLIKIPIRVFNITENKEFKIIASLMIGVFFLNLFNSTFLFSSFDNFVFLIFGYSIGKKYLHEK